MNMISVMDLLGNGFIIMKCVWSGAGRLPLDDCHFHVLDLDTDQQEIDLAHYHVFQVVPEKNNIFILVSQVSHQKINLQ